ncbi:MAG: aminotransferase class I/II-fold pyridoxal phosphate-dependent enzyme [Clostridiales bacterium]|nr:aminotransferase class I/II-fold pyridoxal phosphate-dependent enzyme [Clostridiales bacterium]
MFKNMPLVNGLTEYISKNQLAFHMPGHKGGRLMPELSSFSFAQMDMTEVSGLDNLQSPEGIIREAQQLAAKAFQSDACFFLINGSTSGIHAMMMATFQAGDQVLIPRNCHKSVWGGLILSGAEPVFIQPEYDEERCLVTHVSPGCVRQAIRENPNAKGMVITNPDYYGLCPQLSEIQSILAINGMKLLVDEAHGPHLIFHPDLPPSAAQCRADLWVQSAHKTLPALTQAAYLHIGNQVSPTDSRLIEKVTQYHRLLQSTSPSYLIMASLDYARAYMEEHGKVSLDMLLEHLTWTRSELNTLGIDTMQGYSRSEIYQIDATRLVLDISKLGLTGFQGEEILRQAGVQVEMSDSHRLVLVCTVADRREDFQCLVDACKHLSTHMGNREIKGRKLTISREIPRQMLSPKEAFAGNVEWVLLDQAAGRICGGAPVGPYPPGIPSYYPGELITKSGLEGLLENQAQGAQLFGLSEDDKISVIID